MACGTHPSSHPLSHLYPGHTSGPGALQNTTWMKGAVEGRWRQALNPSPTPSQMRGFQQASQLPHVPSGLGFLTVPAPQPHGPHLPAGCHNCPSDCSLGAGLRGDGGGVWILALLRPPGTDPFLGRWPL